MRILFLGTPEFAVPSLQALLDSPHQVVGVMTVPDRPQGRGRKLRSSPVKTHALAADLPILQPEDLKAPDLLEKVRALAPDLMVVVAFRILPPELYDIPTMGTFNLHASLLPRYRGAAPIHWALLNGDEETGLTTFFLERRVDTGNILLQQTVPIRDEDDLGSLHDRLSAAGADLVLQTVTGIETGRIKPRRQDPAAATRAPKVTREDRILDFSEPAIQCWRRARAFAPAPGAVTQRQGKQLKILACRPEKGDGAPGQILQLADDHFLIACREGALAVYRVQPEGKRAMSAAAFLLGSKLSVGEMLG